jgi:CubicO group peptidase (beta-lactamase class C family)
MKPPLATKFPRQSRRQFLASAAAGLAAWPVAERALGQPTGPAMPKLAAYDQLMEAFMREHKPPGAALAVAYHGRLVYSRGFGHADVEKQEPVHPTSLFRIASLSKPFTATAVMHLIQQGRLKFEDRVLPHLKLEPHLERGARMDPRWHEITVRQCLQHTGGWNRDKSFDPMDSDTAEAVAKALKVPLPITPRQIIRYTMGKPLDFAPGTAYAYSNFGYCVLGRVIENITHKPYHEFVAEAVFAPAGIRHMRLGKNLLKDRAPDEVRYYDSKRRSDRAICGPEIGKQVPLPYGVEGIETMDANGGWIASAVDLLRFATALDDPKHCRILKEESLLAQLAPPPGPVGHGLKGKSKDKYYACGWDVRPLAKQPNRFTKWHTGLLGGTSTLLVCRDDGIDWAALFNCDADKQGKQFSGLIDPLLHKPASEIKDWPDVDLFPKFQ